MTITGEVLLSPAKKGSTQGYRSVRQELLQKGSFRAIFRQKDTAGVSLAVSFLLVLHRKVSCANVPFLSEDMCAWNFFVHVSRFGSRAKILSRWPQSGQHGKYDMPAYHIVLFEVLCSFALKIFSHTAALRTQEYWMSFEAEKQGVGEKIRAKPNPFLRNAAQWRLFLFFI